MAKHASHLICPYLFHHSHEARKRRYKGKGKGKDALTFGEVFKLYIQYKLEKQGIPVTTEQGISYMGISGRYDILIPGKVIEVKYSTRLTPEELIEIYKPQAAFYAIALGTREAQIIAGNPVIDKIKIYTMDQNEIKRLSRYISKVVSGYDRPRKTKYCDLCLLKNRCPVFKEKQGA